MEYPDTVFRVDRHTVGYLRGVARYGPYFLVIFVISATSLCPMQLGEHLSALCCGSLSYDRLRLSARAS